MIGDCIDLKNNVISQNEPMDCFRSGTERDKRKTILDTLKFYNILDSNIVKEGIAVIKSAANKRCCNSLSDRK